MATDDRHWQEGTNAAGATHIALLPAALCLLPLAFTIACSLLLLAGCSKSKSPPEPITIYCAAGLNEPMKDLLAEFEKDHGGASALIDYAGSGELLGRLKVSANGPASPDIFVAAEESYAQQARELGLVDRIETLAYFQPVIVVAKGNPKNIQKLEDLIRPDVKTALGEPRGPAIGLVTDKMLAKAGLMSVRQHAAGSFDTVQNVAAQVALRNADAAIVWDTTARQGDFKDMLDIIAIPDSPVIRVVICRVSKCRNAQLADSFIHLATTTELSRKAFTKYGFTVQRDATASTSATSQGTP